jgi:AcrR family transcriptional regulator
LAYEVIKRVSGRAYRYRVESFRDPETRRVRGRWTYLGRVDPADAGVPERPAKLSSRDRLLDAVGRLLETTDAEALSAGSIAREAGVAYGTFYRYFTDRGHAVREALLRNGPSLGDVSAVFGQTAATPASERERVATWVRDAAETARRRRGVMRAWHIYSNADEAVLRARSDTVDNAVATVTAYLERLRAAGVTPPWSPSFAAYALVALVVALGRDTALEGSVSSAKVDGLVALAHELCGLRTLPVRGETRARDGRADDGTGDTARERGHRARENG